MDIELSLNLMINHCKQKIIPSGNYCYLLYTFQYNTIIQ